MFKMQAMVLQFVLKDEQFLVQRHRELKNSKL